MPVKSGNGRGIARGHPRAHGGGILQRAVGGDVSQGIGDANRAYKIGNSLYNYANTGNIAALSSGVGAGLGLAGQLTDDPYARSALNIGGSAANAAGMMSNAPTTLLGSEALGSAAGSFLPGFGLGSAVGSGVQMLTHKTGPAPMAGAALGAGAGAAIGSIVPGVGTVIGGLIGGVLGGGGGGFFGPGRPTPYLNIPIAADDGGKFKIGDTGVVQQLENSSSYGDISKTQQDIVGLNDFMGQNNVRLAPGFSGIGTFAGVGNGVKNFPQVASLNDAFKGFNFTSSDPTINQAIAGQTYGSAKDFEAAVTGAKKSARGGGILYREFGGPTDTGVATVAPSAQTMNPIWQNAAQRYSAMSPEQLQELAVRLGPTQQGQIVQRVLMQRHMMPNTDTGQPINAGQPGQPGQGYADGGGIMHFATGGGPPPWLMRGHGINQGESDSGLLNEATPGRTDKIPLAAAAGSYVIPADVISGLGEGNTLAGAGVMNRALNTGPYGMQLTHGAHGSGPPHPPSGSPQQFASFGGARGVHASGRVPVLAAGGEYMVAPHQVAAIGDGDIRKGHDRLDQFVKMTRRRIINEMQRLPGPVKT